MALLSMLGTMEFSPGGATELSPALQRWEKWSTRFKSRRDDRVSVHALQGLSLDLRVLACAAHVISPRQDCNAESATEKGIARSRVPMVRSISCAFSDSPKIVTNKQIGRASC